MEKVLPVELRVPPDPEPEPEPVVEEVVEEELAAAREPAVAPQRTSPRPAPVRQVHTNDILAIAAILIASAGARRQKRRVPIHQDAGAKLWAGIANLASIAPPSSRPKTKSLDSFIHRGIVGA